MGARGAGAGVLRWVYALALASGAPPAILDWNNNYGADPDMCVCTHCGNYPKSFIGDTPEISELDVLGEVIGREKCFGAVKGKVKAGPMTYFRLSTDDRAGTVKCYLGEGEFTDDPFAMDGGIAVTRVPDDAEMIALANRTPFGLGAAVFSADEDRARRVAERLDTGTARRPSGSTALAPPTLVWNMLVGSSNCWNSCPYGATCTCRSRPRNSPQNSRTSTSGSTVKVPHNANDRAVTIPSFFSWAFTQMGNGPHAWRRPCTSPRGCSRPRLRSPRVDIDPHA